MKNIESMKIYEEMEIRFSNDPCSFCKFNCLHLYVPLFIFRVKIISWFI